MESSNFKNMVVLKNLPSNIIDEAIIILKTNKKVRKVQKIEKNKKIFGKEQKEKEDYILKEAEMIVNNYVSKIEKKKESTIIGKKVEKKYKKYTIILTIISILEMCLLIIL